MHYLYNKRIKYSMIFIHKNRANAYNSYTTVTHEQHYAKKTQVDFNE